MKKALTLYVKEHQHLFGRISLKRKAGRYLGVKRFEDITDEQSVVALRYLKTCVAEALSRPKIKNVVKQIVGNTHDNNALVVRICAKLETPEHIRTIAKMEEKDLEQYIKKVLDGVNIWEFAYKANFF